MTRVTTATKQSHTTRPSLSTNQNHTIQSHTIQSHTIQSLTQSSLTTQMSHTTQSSHTTQIQTITTHSSSITSQTTQLITLTPTTNCLRSTIPLNLTAPSANALMRKRGSMNSRPRSLLSKQNLPTSQPTEVTVTVDTVLEATTLTSHTELLKSY